MNKIFIDCGGNTGQGAMQCIKRYGIDGNWKCFSFEPSFECIWKALKKQELSHFDFIQKLAWIWDGEVDFYTCLDDNSGSSIYQFTAAANAAKVIRRQMNTVVEQRKKRKYNPSGFTKIAHEKVPCVDFAKFLQENVNKNDYCIIKMDVEGAEYDIIKWMWYKNCLDLIDIIKIEWHDRPMEYSDRMTDLLKQYGVTVESHE